MKIVLDTNVVIDVLTNREPFVEASESVMNLAAKGQVQAAISANTITDIAYLLRKHVPDQETVRSALANIMEIFEIIEVNRDRCLQALKLPMSDYEDALLAGCAARWGAECIITRNIKDFANSPVPALTPDQFLEQWSKNSGS